ncbi:MAG: Crp/Fnr family transcriptional regulator [Bacteroidales bacterium]|nr:Crp/Fnr family transcriptional regulator [Bacteroidales bacterium]
MTGQVDFCTPKPAVFHSLNEEELTILRKNSFEVDFKEGETIFKQGSPLTHIIYLTEGKAKLLLENSNQTILMKIVQESDIIIGPGFNRDYRHYFSVVAIQDTRACFINVDIFKQFIELNTSFALSLIDFIHEDTVSHFDKIKNLTNKHMNGRLADTLLYLSDDIYKSHEFLTSLSRMDLANMSSMTKESVIRTLKNFKEDHIIDCKGNEFKILNKEVLIDISKKG